MPLGVLAARVKTPLLSTLKGPAIIEVTTLFAAETNCEFKVSLAVTFKTVLGEFPETTVGGKSFIASIVLFITTVAVAVSQFAGFAPTSHNS